MLPLPEDLVGGAQNHSTGVDGRTCPTHRATTTGRGAAREITHSPSSPPRLADGSTASLSRKSEGPWVPDHENSILTFDCQDGHLLSQHLSQVLSSVKDVLPVVPHCLDDFQLIGHESSGSAVPSCEGLTIDETCFRSSSVKGRNMAFVLTGVKSCNELYTSFKRHLLCGFSIAPTSPPVNVGILASIAFITSCPPSVSSCVNRSLKAPANGTHFPLLAATSAPFRL